MSAHLEIINLQEAVFFVLNGKGKFYRTLINPMKMPTMEQLLEEVSSGLEAAIYRFYTPDGQRLSTVEEILSSNTPKIISCPRNERPFMETKKSFKLPEIKPSRYAPRSKTDSTYNSLSTSASTSTGSNGIEKREKMPPIRGKPVAGAVRKRVSPIKMGEKAKQIKNANHWSRRNEKAETTTTTSASSANSAKDSGTGNSINSWTTADAPETTIERRPESMTEEKAAMIREERTAESDHPETAMASEDDLILEEESDYERAGIDSGTSSGDEDLVESKAYKQSAESREETPAVHTPDTTVRETPEPAAETQTEKKKIVRQQTGKPDEDGILEEEQEEPEKEEQENDKEIILPSDDDEIREEEKEEQDEPGNDKEIILPSDDEAEEKTIKPPENDEEKAATKIQAVFRGFKTRKQLKVNFGHVEDIPNIPDEINEPPDIENTGVEVPEAIKDEEGDSLRSAPAGVMTYTIELKIGFRYGADTEADLYLFLHGDEAVSQRILLRQETDWLLNPHTQFTEGSTVRFFVESPILGTIHKLVVGHDRYGYGAGLFIEYVMIAENSVDGRQFYFSINKWFDSGQVDGKIERTCFLTTFLYLTARPIVDNPSTRGRWEFVVHSRKDEYGGTTSNLTLVGYGDHDFTINSCANNLMMRDASMNPLIQVDFGTHLGQLRKVRLEIDGAGERPNYFIEYVEIRDLDTDERSAHMINKWLVAKPEEMPKEFEKDAKKFQPFREITIFQKMHMPLPLTTYEGKVILADTKLCDPDPYPINLQLIGPAAQTGVFPVIPTKLTSGKTIYTFKIEAVSLGTITEVRLVPRISRFGQDVLGGLQFLQEIYERHELPIFVASDFFVHEISVRETGHAPFRHIFGHSEIHLDQNNAKGPYFKSLIVKVIEGLATTKKVAKGEETREKPMNFLMFISVEEPENAEIPHVSLYSKSGALAKMVPLDVAPTQEGVITYQLETSPEFGLVEKIRVGVDEIGAGKIAFIKKLRLVETSTSTEVRFVFFNELREFEVVEMMCVYPDVAPKISIPYTIQLKTTSSKGSFRPFLNLIGTDGDSGFRAYPGLTEFPDDTNVQMEVEALKLGTLKSIAMYLVANDKEDKKKTSWKGVLKVAADEDVIYTTSTVTIKKQGETITSDLTLIENNNDY